MRRRKRERVRRFRRILAVTVILLLCVVSVVAVRKSRQQAAEQERQRQETLERLQNAESIKDICAGVQVVFNEIGASYDKGDELPDAFKTVSMDYGGEEEGFVYYEIPEEYQRTGGYLPEEVQIYTYCLCKQEGVRYALILAMIEHESGYRYDSIGDDGESVGYMQIMEKWHEDRMEELGANLLDPYQNIRIGVDIMKELINKYGTIQDALAAYNYGETGARRYLWSNGIYVYDYNESIMSRMKEIEEELHQ